MFESVDPQLRVLALMGTLAVLSFLILRSKGKGTDLHAIRKMRKAGSENVVRRQSEETELTSSAKADRDKAMKLIAEGKVVDGARILENIGLDRIAIAALEADGFVDEACAMLLRLDRPERAALMFERHNRFVEAAEYYLLGDNPALAGQNYMLAGQTDKRNFILAAKVFERSGDVGAAVEGYVAGGKYRRAFELCKRENCFELLTTRITRPGQGAQFCKQLTMTDLEDLFVHIAGKSNSVSWFQLISVVAHNPEVVTLCSKALLPHVGDLNLFWSKLPEGLIKESVQNIEERYVLSEGSELLFGIACALLSRGAYRPGARVFLKCGEYSAAALCFAACAEYADALVSLRRAQADSQTNQLAELLQAHSEMRIDEKELRATSLELIQRLVLNPRVQLHAHTDELAAG